MAIDGGDVKFSFTGDSSDLNSALAKASKNLDGLTVAGQGAANKISKDLSKATTTASKSIDGFTESAGDADSVMMGLAGAIDLVNPALGDMVRVSGDVLAGTEAVGRAIKFSNPIFIALAAAAAALGGAYYLLKEDTEEAEEAAERLAEQQLKVNQAMAKGKDALFAARSDLAALSGAFTKSEIAMFKATQQANGAYAPAIATLSEEIEAATKEEQRLLKVITDKGITMEDDKQRHLDAQKVTQDLRDQRSQLRDEEEELAATLNATAERKAEIAAQDAAEAAAEKARDETKRRRLKAQSDALKEAADRTKDLQKANEEMGESSVKTWSEIGEAWAALQDRQRKEMQEIQDAERDAFHQRLGYFGDFIDASGDLAEGLTARLGASAEQQALAAYIVSKASALSQIAISTIVASAKVTEQTGVGAAVAVPAVVALGAMQAAAVLAEPPPKFHSGGMIAPDERMITAQTGEAVLSRSGVAAAGGASGVNALNRGGGGREIVVVNQYRHRVFDSFIMDNLRRTGSPLAAAISATGSKAGIA
jgi:hypothetical protein